MVREEEWRGGWHGGERAARKAREGGEVMEGGRLVAAEVALWAEAGVGVMVVVRERVECRWRRCPSPRMLGARRRHSMDRRDRRVARP